MGLLILSSMHLPARDVEPRSRVDASGVCVVGSILGLNTGRKKSGLFREWMCRVLCVGRGVLLRRDLLSTLVILLTCFVWMLPASLYIGLNNLSEASREKD